MPRSISDPRQPSAPGLRGALSLRLAERGPTDLPLVLPVAGGPGALLSRRRCRHLASLLDPSAVDAERAGLRGWLERRQARRSRLVLVPDRATAMRFAGRWKLDLARVHLAPDLANPPDELISENCGRDAGRTQRMRPWYTT